MILRLVSDASEMNKYKFRKEEMEEFNDGMLKEWLLPHDQSMDDDNNESKDNE